MSRPKVLFLSPGNDIHQLVDDVLELDYEPLLVSPGHVSLGAATPGAEIRAAVIDGYSELPIVRGLPQAEALLSQIPTLAPRIYLLRDASPTLEPDRLDRSQTVLYLRGPVSPGRIRVALHRLLSRKERRGRFNLDPQLQIGTYFRLHSSTVNETFFRELVEIGPEGMSFHWSREAPPLFPGDRLEQVALVARGEAFWTTEAEVRHLSAVIDDDGRASVRVGVEFTGSNELSRNRQATERDAFERSHLTDSLLVRTALREMKERQTRAVVQPEGLGETCEGKIVDLRRVGDEDRLLVQLTEAPLPGTFKPVDIVTGHFVRDNAQLRFCTTVCELDGTDLHLRMPGSLERLWARSNLRYNPEAGAAPIQVELFTPLSPRKPMERELVDLSPDGLSFRAHAENDLLLPGMRLQLVCLHLGKGPPVRTSAEVRHLGTVKDSEGRVICGLQFVNMDRPTQHQLVDYLINKSFPEVDDACDADAESLWQFLVHTNYLSEAKRSIALYPEASIRSTQNQLLNAPTHLSRSLVFRNENRISGTVSITRIYSQTWMVHHLAASLKTSAMVPRSLMLYLGEYISKTPDIEYVRMMWRPANNWSNRMLGRLIHRLHNHDQSVVKHYLYLDRPTDQPVEAGDPEGWRVRPLLSTEANELELHFIRRREYFLMKSEDLHRTDPWLNGLAQQYGMSQLDRRREILVAERHGVLGGFLLLEHGSPGFNLSNLLHACRVVITDEAQLESQVVSRQLIAAAIERYGALGQRKAVALTEDYDKQLFEAMGFVQRKEYITWTFGQDIASFYNLYCHYIFRVYERLERRLRARSQRLSATDRAREIADAEAQTLQEMPSLRSALSI